MILRNTRALGVRFLFNFGLLTLCVIAMLSVLAAIGLGPLELTFATTMALVALVILHLSLISSVYVPAAVKAERAAAESAAK
ncbi:MAG: hypothetical protein GXP03_03775 [Alphaproteobacteria bacterium]|nr:hypothetical protein [Alphaproteobacteria bacterium]